MERLNQKKQNQLCSLFQFCFSMYYYTALQIVLGMLLGQHYHQKSIYAFTSLNGRNSSPKNTFNIYRCPTPTMCILEIQPFMFFNIILLFIIFNQRSSNSCISIASYKQYSSKSSLLLYTDFIF